MRKYILDDLGFLAIGWVAPAKISVAYVAWASGLLHGARAIAAPRWALIVLAIVLLDLGNYFAHWLLHRVGVLWEFHKVHHSSLELDWLATFRSHLVEQILRRLVAPLLLIAIGFPLPVVAIAGGVFIAWAIFNHMDLEVRFGILERIVITPRLHRIHHRVTSSERNLGTILTLWDRLRGRFVLEAPEAPLGVPGDASYPQRFGALLREPFRGL